MTEEKWEYMDFVWTPPSPIRWTFSDTKANSIDRAQFLAIKSEAWSENRAQILQALQEYLNQGWEVFVEIGPDCWETNTREYVEYADLCTFICYLIIGAALMFIPCIICAKDLAVSKVDYSLVAFRVQLRRPKSNGKQII